MASQQFPNENSKVEEQQCVAKASPHKDELSFVPLPDFSSNQNKTIIVQMNSKSVSTSSGKLKSLLPKNLLNLPKSELGLESPVGTNVIDIQAGNFGNFPATGEIIVAQQFDENNQNQFHQAQNELSTVVTKSEALETLFSQLHSSLANHSYIEPDGDKQANPDLAQVQGNDKSCSLTTTESLKSTTETNQPSFISSTVSSVGDVRPAENPTSTLPVSHLSQASSEDQDKEQEVVKKTMVEAFVKMVVCRKVTVQKVDAKTGQILDTKFKTEEDEPVVLGVDCVETTEDIISSTAAELAEASNSSELLSSKWGTSLDGGLKFLSAVSESRQKIGKSLIKDKLLKSKMRPEPDLESSKAQESSQDGVVDASVVKHNMGKTTDIKNDSEGEWNEDLYDDSEDYVPPSGKQASSKSLMERSERSKTKIFDLNKPVSINNGDHVQIKEESIDEGYGNTDQSDSIVFFPKKRGRKRKWDNAIGMASNLRNCQFCNKHFSNTRACAKHMKKGKCVASLYCFICSKPVQSEQQLEVHLLSHANGAKSGVFECRDCNRAYRTRAGYAKHFRMGTCQKRDDFEDGYTGDFVCDICPSRFSTEGYLKLHKYKVHENPKDTHTCSDCGKRFYSSQGFNKHRMGRPCTQPLKCLICGKTYSSKARESFKVHMKHHKSEISGETFNCDECGRSYMTQMALNKHKLSHTGVKPYKCNFCGKEFSMRYMVKDHARMHTGERPYLCSLCGSAFSNKGHLGRHIRSHQNGTLLKRGRPKKIKEPDENNSQETELKMIDLTHALQSIDGHAMQVVEGQMFDSQSSGTPMIITANNNTIIIAEGWSNTGSSGPAITVPSGHEIANVTNIVSSHAS